MCEELQENKKRFEDIKERTELKKYLYSFIKSDDESKLVKEMGIQRDFLRRVVGDNDPPKSWVKSDNAYPLCKFIASHEKKTVEEVLGILIKNGLLPDDIRPDRKMFEENNQQEEREKNDADIEKIEEDDQRKACGENDAGIETFEEDVQQDETEKNDESIEELTDCIKGIIENMHFRIKEKEWRFKSDLKYQTIEVEKDSILLAGIETWESVGLAYLSNDTFDKDFEQIYEILRTHGKDKKILFLILCKDCDVYEKAYENIKMLKSENSILIISLEKSREALIVSMHNKHRKAFKYEKEFASCKEEVLSFMG